MLVHTTAAALLGLACTLTAAADEPTRPKADDTGKAGKLDRAKLFGRLDADGDGKLTKDEYRKSLDAIAQKLKDAGKGEKIADKLGQFAEKGFGKLDANGDGVVTKEEFEKADGAVGKLKAIKKKGG